MSIRNKRAKEERISIAKQAKIYSESLSRVYSYLEDQYGIDRENCSGTRKQECGFVHIRVIHNLNNQMYQFRIKLADESLRRVA